MGGLLAALALLLTGACGGSRANLPNNDDGWPLESWFTNAYNYQRTRRVPYPGPATVRQAWSVALATYSSSPTTVGPDGTLYAGTGFSVSAFSPQGTELWLLPLDHEAASQPLLDGAGNTYVRLLSAAAEEADRRDALIAVSPGGQLLWRWEAESALVDGPVLGAGETLYVLAADRVVALRLDGSVKWVHPLGVRPGNLALGQEGNLYLSLTGEDLVALSPSGAELWRKNIGRVFGANLAPAPGSGVLLGIRAQVAEYGWRVLSYGEDGSQRWVSEPIPTLDQGPVVGSADRIYVLGNFGSLYALDGTGQLQWTFTAHSSHGYPPVVSPDGVVYLSQVGPDNGQSTGVIAVNPNGSQRYFWLRTSLHDLSFAPTAGPGGTLIVASFDRLQELDADGGLTWDHLHTGQALGAPVLSQDGQLYFTASRNLIALDRDGHEAWRYSAPTGFITPPFLIQSGGTQAVGCLNYTDLVACGAQGGLVWQAEFPGWNGAVPAQAEDGTLFLAGNDETLYALHPNGALDWSKPLPGIHGASASLAPDGTVLVASDKLLYSVNPTSTINWWLEFEAALTSQVAIAADGTAYLASSNGRLYAVLPNGLIQWAFQCPLGLPRPPAIGADGKLFVGTTNVNGQNDGAAGTLVALSPAGVPLWTFAQSGYNASSAAVDSVGNVYFAIDNTLYAADPEGVEIWRAITQTNLGSPVLGQNGRVYVSGGSQVYCFAP